MRTLYTSEECLKDFLLEFQKQADQACNLSWDESLQLSSIIKLRKVESLPDDCASVDFDFATLIEYMSGISQSQGEFLGSGKFSLETYITHMKMSADRKLCLAARIKKYIIQSFSEDKGKDAYCHVVNMKNVLDIIQDEMIDIEIVYEMSDGPRSTYKSSKRFEESKQMAVDRGFGIMCNFCPTGCGKGEHDREGGLTAKDYKTKCTRAIGVNCRDLGCVRTWNEEERSFIDSESTDKRIFLHSPYDEVSECREGAPHVETLFCAEKGFITRNHYCFYLSSDAEENGVWYRKYTCTSCKFCKSGEWDLIRQCENELCGPWRYVEFEYKVVGQKRKNDDMKFKVGVKKFNCACGGTISRSNYYSHVKNKKT